MTFSDALLTRSDLRATFAVREKFSKGWKMTTLRTGALWLSLIALSGCGSDAQVTGPSMSNSATGLPQSFAGSGATGLVVGPQANATANGGSPVVPMSMVIPKTPPKTAAPAAAPAAPGAPAAAPGGVPGVPGAAPGVPGAAPGGVPGAAPVVPGAPGMAPGAPGMAPGAPAPGAAPGGATPPPAMAPVGGMAPIVPEVSGDCPDFRNSTITFMGLGGITVVAGAKASSPSAPFVFYWHGTGSFAGEYAGSAAAVASGLQQEGGVLVSFQSTTGGDFLSGTAIFGAGDMDLGDQLLACAVKNHNVDPKRVFATGCSAGGLFSTAQGAMRSNYMAAVAPNSGGLTIPVQFQSAWTPALMTIHGAAGVDVVGIDFSESSATADMIYKQRNAFVINCDTGGIHCGGGGLSGEIWQFFKAHPYGTVPSPWKDALPAGFSAQCKIY